MNLGIKGKSGSKIEVINDNFTFKIRKYSRNTQENQRHVKRGQKQYDFFNNRSYKNIKTPEIFNIVDGDSGNLSYVDMQYISGVNILEFLKEADIKSIDTFMETITSYLDDIISESKIVSRDKYENIFKNKVDELSKLDFPRKEYIINKLRNLPKEDLPLGYCHGDLTLANTIYANSTIYIVDFLDIFIESPVFDILSLRQDTKHLWSCFLQDTYDCRSIELFSYIDNKLEKKYESLIKNEWYNYLSLMNYVRMYRMYDTSVRSRELDYIFDCITKYL